MHEVDHKIKDIIVYAYFFIILGSNSHTVSWHSVHPALEPLIEKRQQFFSAFSLQSGVIAKLLNKTTNETEPYFVGYQRRHIYFSKVNSVGAYLSCDPQSVKQDVVGEHNISVSFFSYNFNDNNSYQVIENKAFWTLQVNRIYADGLAAGAIIGIVIGSIVILVAVIIIVYKKVKAQTTYKEVLQLEVDSFIQRRGSFNSLRRNSGNNQIVEESPKQRQASEPNFIVTEPRQQTDNIIPHPEEGGQKYKIDDDDD